MSSIIKVLEILALIFVTIALGIPLFMTLFGAAQACRMGVMDVITA